MSYQPTAGISDYAATALNLFAGAKSGLQIGVAVLEDPYLPETACEVMRLSKAQAGENPGPRCAATSRADARKTTGVGLRYAVTPLRAYIWHRQNPWVIPAAVGAGLALIFYAGMLTGKRRKR